MGQFRRAADVKSSFTRGLGVWRSTPLAEQFVKMCLPTAKARGADAPSLFRRVWDQFVMSLRETDLISNEEQCRLMYGDGVLGVENQLPLFMYAGKIRTLIKRTGRIAQLAITCATDEEFKLAALPDPETEDAVAEVLAALPHILTLVCNSHSAIGFSDAHVAGTLQALFTPKLGASVCDTVARLLSPAACGPKGPREKVREIAALVARLMVAFESDTASTRLRGSPLLSLSIQLLQAVQRLWNPQLDAPGGPGSTVGAPGGGAGGGPLRLPPGMDPGAPGASFAAPTLEMIANAAMHERSASIVAAVGPGYQGLAVLQGEGEGEEGQETAEAEEQPAEGNGSGGKAKAKPKPFMKARSGVGGYPAASAAAAGGGGGGGGVATAGPLDTRSVRGIIALLQTPNEGSGKLDGDDDPDTVDRLEALRGE